MIINSYLLKLETISIKTVAAARIVDFLDVLPQNVYIYIYVYLSILVKISAE